MSYTITSAGLPGNSFTGQTGNYAVTTYGLASDGGYHGHFPPVNEPSYPGYGYLPVYGQGLIGLNL